MDLFRKMETKIIFIHIEIVSKYKHFDDLSYRSGILNDMELARDYRYNAEKELNQLVNDLYVDKYRDKFDSLIKEFYKEVKREWVKDDIFLRGILDNIKIPEHHEDGGLIFYPIKMERDFTNHMHKEFAILLKDIKSLDKKRV